jgi:hypothetical protein
VGPRAGLDYAERRKILRLPGLELRPLGRPASSQSLYRLRDFQYSLLSFDALFRVSMGGGSYLA